MDLQFYIDNSGNGFSWAFEGNYTKCIVLVQDIGK